MKKALCISEIQNFKVGQRYPILRFSGHFDKQKSENMIELYEPNGSKVIECLPVFLFKKYFILSENEPLRKDYPAIQIYVKGRYWATTNWFKTCREAKASYIDRDPTINPVDVKCYFRKS